MNDFTKEELEELMHCVYAYRDLCDEDVDDILSNKLQSLIDNYCEHPSIIPEFGSIHTCTECKEIVGGSRIPEENLVKYNAPKYEYKIEGDTVISKALYD